MLLGVHVGPIAIGRSLTLISFVECYKRVCVYFYLARGDGWVHVNVVCLIVV